PEDDPRLVESLIHSRDSPMGLATGCDPDIAALNLAGMS
ncbi:hypothetical protein JMJ77_0009682, partial [Colletotrichum scovillei]